MRPKADQSAKYAAHRRIDLYRRAFDLVVGTLGLLLALPVIVLVSLACGASLRAWPIFTQDRIGRDGRAFRFHKVRTLPTSAPAYLDKHRLDLGTTTPLCRAVRRLHLDELPQLALVLRGHMSLVGPRPEMPHLHDAMCPKFASERTAVRPGCTGLWQVSEACRGLISESPEWDRWYLEHRTLRLDLWVLSQTLLKMLGVGRRITFADVPAWAAPAVRAKPELASTTTS